MTPSEAAELSLRRRQIRTDFGVWCRTALEPFGQAPAAHHELLIRELQDIADGKNDRLIIMMPPGSAKSTYASKLFPAWYLASKPAALLIGASHSQSLADTFSRNVQTFIKDNSADLGYGLLNEAVDFWAVNNGGSYRAVGVGGSVTGRRADLIVIDDPVKGEEHANSQLLRDKLWDWYRSDLYTRLRPGGSVVVIMTRWHEDDICGRLLKEQAEGGDKWRVLELPALAEAGDPLGREIGAPLWPEWEGIEALERKRRVVGERAFASLFQQKPRPLEGSIIKSGWWKPWHLPIAKPDFTLVSLDLAYTKKETNDPSACTVWDVTAGEEFRSRALLRFAWTERLEFPELLPALLETVKAYKKPLIPMRVLIEAKGPGLSVEQELRRRAPDLNIVRVVPRGDKEARAHAVTSLFEAGIVWAPVKPGWVPDPDDADKKPVWRPWMQMVIDECAAFPLGKHDDLVDSVTQALRHIRDMGIEFFAEDAPPAPMLAEPEPLY